jgi:hypothetical protein
VFLVFVELLTLHLQGVFGGYTTAFGAFEAIGFGVFVESTVTKVHSLPTALGEHELRLNFNFV